MAQQDFRTVQYEGSRVNRGDVGVNVASGQGALDSDAQYMQRQLQRSGEGIQQNNTLAYRQAQQLDQMEIQRQQLVAQQMSARNEAVLRSEDLYGRQQLANSELRNRWQDEIGKLQLTQKISSDQIKTQLSSNQAEALTQLGEQIVGFSKTLWEVKAQDINRKNQELQAQGLMDEIYGLGKTDEGDIARVDQAQYSKLSAQGRAELTARQLENQGLPNDAARIRADNPFYLYGRQEGAALRAAQGVHTHLEQSVAAAKERGVLKLGDPNYDVALRMVLKDATREYIIQTGLTGLPPAVAARYFRDALLEAETSVARSANKENKIYVDQATALVARNNASLAFEEVGRNPAEVNKIVSQQMNLPGDMEQNLRALYNDYVGLAQSTENLAPLEALVQHPMMRFLEDDYLNWKSAFEEKLDQQMEQAQQEFFEMQKSGFEIALRNAKPEDVPAIREKYAEIASRMPLKYRNQLEQLVNTAQQGNYSSEKVELDDLVRRSSPSEVASNLEAWKKRNPQATPEAVAEADRIIKSFSKAIAPWAQNLLDEFSTHITTLEDPNTSAARAMDAGYNRKVQAIVKLRQQKLEARFKEILQRLGGGATPDAVRSWWTNSNGDLKQPIRPDANGNFPELDMANRATPSTTKGPAVVIIKNWKGRDVADLSQPKDQALIAKGVYGRINTAGSVLLRPDQLKLAVEALESGRPVDPLVKQLADRSNPPVNVSALVQQQLALYGVPGWLKLPQDPRQTQTYSVGTNNGQRVSSDYAFDFGRSKGLSARGARWFAQTIMDESGGDPNAIHDQGTGMGLWGARLDRRDNMIAYAQSKGFPPNDPVAQMEYALLEIKKGYPSLWKIITSSNPTTNQLFRVSRQWLRFDERLNSRRLQSLINVLGDS